MKSQAFFFLFCFSLTVYVIFCCSSEYSQTPSARTTLVASNVSRNGFFFYFWYYGEGDGVGLWDCWREVEVM